MPRELKAETEIKATKTEAEKSNTSRSREVYYRSNNPEFEDCRHFLQTNSKAAPSANDTKTVIGINKKDIERELKKNSENKQAGEGEITKNQAGKVTIITPAETIKYKYTVKRVPNNIGRTLAEVAAQMRLKKMREKPIEGQDDKKNHREEEKKTNRPPRYAETFFVTQSTTTDHRYKIATLEESFKYTKAQDFINNLYAASLWQPVAFAINASKLLGIGKRQIAAGTRSPNLFRKLRELNKKYNLGLEYIFHGACVTVDLDLHLDNCLLNFDISQLSKDDKEKALKLIESFKTLFEENTGKPLLDENKYFEELEIFITEMKKLGGASIYFHKIDHDSGDFRFCDPVGREVTLRDHGTSVTHVSIEGKSIHVGTQPTNHIAELNVEASSPADFILTSASIDTVTSNTIRNQLADSEEALVEFFAAIKNQCIISVSEVSEQLRAELILLKHFDHHITSGHQLPVDVGQIIELETEIELIRGAIQNKMKEATIARGISLHKEYLDFIVEYEASQDKIEEEEKSIEQFKVFLNEDIKNGIKLKIELNSKKIVKEYNDKRRWFSFISDAEKKEDDKIINNIKAGDLDKVFVYLSEEKNKSHRLYKIIEKHIGERCMPLYMKSPIKKFREGLAGIRKIAFWGGLALIGAGIVGGIVIGAAILSGGFAIPLLLPAIVSMVGGVGVAGTTIAAATNPATYRWYRNAHPLAKVGFVIGVLVVLGAATVLTGGAALAAVGAISVAAGIFTLLGIKASASVTAAAAVAAKAATLTVGAAEGAGFAAKTMIKSTNTKTRKNSSSMIVQGLSIPIEEQQSLLDNQITAGSVGKQNLVGSSYSSSQSSPLSNSPGSPISSLSSSESPQLEGSSEDDRVPRPRSLSFGKTD